MKSRRSGYYNYVPFIMVSKQHVHRRQTDLTGLRSLAQDNSVCMLELVLSGQFLYQYVLFKLTMKQEI